MWHMYVYLYMNTVSTVHKLCFHISFSVEFRRIFGYVLLSELLNPLCGGATEAAKVDVAAAAAVVVVVIHVVHEVEVAHLVPIRHAHQGYFISMAHL